MQMEQTFSTKSCEKLSKCSLHAGRVLYSTWRKVKNIHNSFREGLILQKAEGGKERKQKGDKSIENWLEIISYW